MILRFAALLLCAMVALPAGAVDPSERLADPALEARARTISQELRCLVCQNQSIDDSDAQLARDLRLLVRERLKAGDSDKSVVEYVVSRYGDFVLLKPPFKAETFLLWFGPAIIGVLGLGVLVAFFRRRRTAEAPTPLTEDEKRRLARLLDKAPK